MSKQKIYIVDGYNVIRAGNLYVSDKEQDWTDDFFNAARDRLINDIASFVGVDDVAYVIFDAKNNEFSDGKINKVGRVNVIYSKFGADADSEVIRLAVKHRGQNASVFVVTSDASIQFSTMGEGVRRMSALDFCREISDNDGDCDDLTLNSSIGSANQLGRMIDAETYSKLIAIRDGLDV